MAVDRFQIEVVFNQGPGKKRGRQLEASVDDIGPRRRQNPALPRRMRESGLRIEIYDMGRKWNGAEFADINFQYPVTYTHVGTNPLLRPNYTGFTIRDTILPALRNYILDYPIDQIAEKHPRLGTADEGGWYYLNILTGNDYDEILRDSSSEDGNWTPAGWKVTAEMLSSPTFAILQGFDGSNVESIFNQVWLVGYAKNKITALPMRTSPVVPYAPQNKDKIFLMPVLLSPEVQMQYRETLVYPDATPPELKSIEQYYETNLRTLPREPFLDPLDDNYLRGIIETNSNFFDGIDYTPSDDTDRLIDFMFNRGYYTGYFTANWFMSTGSHIWRDSNDPALYGGVVLDADSFPPSTATPIKELSIALHRRRLHNYQDLRAVIKRDAEIFYVWG